MTTFLVRVLRVCASVVSSVVLGGFCGGLAMVAMGGGHLAEFGVIFGAIVGVVTCPALVYGLWDGDWVAGAMCIATPTVVAAYVGGLLATESLGPLVPALLSNVVYIGASLLWARAVKRSQRRQRERREQMLALPPDLWTG